MPHTLNWSPRHDPRSRDYPIRAMIPGPVTRTATSWALGPILDQGTEGACVGFGYTAAAAAAPLRYWEDPDPAELTEAARAIYAHAQRIDAYPGEDYIGTSLNAGAKAARALGLIGAYHWAFGIEDVIDALCTIGPVVLGMSWHRGMYTPRAGVMRRAGAIVGGHCTAATAYDPAAAALGGRAGVQIQNSWGTGWGDRGQAWIAADDLDAMLNRHGEACILTARG